MLSHFFKSTPELFLSLGGCFVLLNGVFFQKKAFNVNFLTSILVLAFSFAYFCDSGYSAYKLLNTNLSQMVLFFGVICVAYGRFFIKQLDTRDYEYLSMLLFSILGAITAINSENFLTLFLGIELMALPTYALVTISNKRMLSSEAAIKYFVIGGLSSCLFLLGMSFYYLFSGGTINFVAASSVNHLLLIATLLMLLSSFMKLSLFPFHVWIPDVYEGTAASVICYLTSIPKIVGFVIWFKVLSVLPVDFEIYHQMMLVIGVVSVFYGNIMALHQVYLKRMMAYSTISHMGFIAAALSSNNVVISIYYLFMYILVSILLFAVIAYMERGIGKEIEVKSLAEQTNKHKHLKHLLFFLVLSLSGLPPFGLFFAKVFVLNLILQKGLYIYAILLVMGSLIGFYYYLSIIKNMYFGENDLNSSKNTGSSVISSINLMLLHTIVISVVGVYPLILLQYF